jgi:hypothetical protein
MVNKQDLITFIDYRIAEYVDPNDTKKIGYYQTLKATIQYEQPLKFEQYMELLADVYSAAGKYDISI